MPRTPLKGSDPFNYDKGNPVLVEVSKSELNNLRPGTDGKVKVFTNGIFNSKAAAAGYSLQMSEISGGDHIYLVYYPEANNAISELVVAGFQKVLEGGIADLSVPTQEVKSLAGLYGAQGLDLIAHSRGAMTVGNALDSLSDERESVGVLSDTSIKLVGPAYNAVEAANLLDYLSGGQQTTVQLQNHADDFVGGWIGRNPDTYDKRPADSNKPNEWFRIFGGPPTVHSCGGTGEISHGCTARYGKAVTVDIPSARLKRQGGNP